MPVKYFKLFHLMLIMTSAVLLNMPVIAEETAQSKPADDTAWGSDATPNGSAGALSNLLHPIENEKELTIGPPGTFLVVIDKEVWNLQTRTKITTLKIEPIGSRANRTTTNKTVTTEEKAPAAASGSPDFKTATWGSSPAKEPAAKPQRSRTTLIDRDAERNSWELRTISADGKYFATTRTSLNNNTTIACYSLETGAELSQINAENQQSLKLLILCNNGYLLVGEDNANGMCTIWKASTGEKFKSIQLTEKQIRLAAINQDGRYLAVAGDKMVSVYNMPTGDRVAMMKPPLISNTSDMMFINSSAKGLSFSPNGKELAMVTTTPSSYLLVWDQRGNCINEIPIDVSFMSMAKSLEWLPNNMGWFISGYVLVDRKFGRTVMTLPEPFAYSPDCRFIDPEHLFIMLGPHNKKRMDTITIPWKLIKKSVASFTSNDKALLRPGMSVSLVFEMKNLRGDEADTKTRFTNAFITRLKRDNMQIADGQNTMFICRFSEEAGQSLKIFEGGFGAFGGKDTGRTALEANGTMVIELVSKTRSKPLWSTTNKLFSSRTINEEINDQTVRKTMLERGAIEISNMHYPYYIPADEDVESLPMQIQ